MDAGGTRHLGPEGRGWIFVFVTFLPIPLTKPAYVIAVSILHETLLTVFLHSFLCISFEAISLGGDVVRNGGLYLNGFGLRFAGS